MVPTPRFQERCILKMHLPDEGGRRGFRLELDEFLQDNAMTNLFLIAVSNMQKNSLVPIVEEDGTKNPNWLNYYGLAGIHGQPREEWNGREQPQEPIGRDPNKPPVWPGFCHHSMDTFPIWHRPFTAIFEMAVYEEMVRVAAQYSDDTERQLYEDAAARFRLPYWDPCMPRNEYEPGNRKESVFGTPKILAAHRVWVKLPNPTDPSEGPLEEIDNPLYRFVYPTQEEKSEPWALENREPLFLTNTFHQRWTTRVPLSGDTNDEQLNVAIQSHASVLATALFQMLNPDRKQNPINAKNDKDAAPVNQQRSFSSFANNQVKTHEKGGKVFTSQSIEGFHDIIHMCVATGTSKSHADRGRPGAVDTHITIDPDRKADDRREGAMASTAYAAYDPIFPLLHNNVDRILAIYQALYPGRWIKGQALEDPLYPFAKDSLAGKSDVETPEEHWWRPVDNEMQQYWHSGFAIPGKKEHEGDQKEFRKKIMQYLADRYFWVTNNEQPAIEDWPMDLSRSWALTGRMEDSSPEIIMQMSALVFDEKSGSTEIVTTSTAGQAIVSESVIEEKIDKIHKALPLGALVNLDKKDVPTKQITWNAHVKTRKFAFGGSYTVHLFMGTSAESTGLFIPGLFMTKKNEVGFTGVFSSSFENQESCPNCVKQRQEDIIIADVIPLTTILYDYLESTGKHFILEGGHRTIKDLTPESVLPFLKEHLNWEIIDATSTLLTGREEEAGLEIVVSSREYESPSKEHPMGVYYPKTAYTQVTAGKVGGYTGRYGTDVNDYEEDDDF